jgi:hypothetical protein
LYTRYSCKVVNLAGCTPPIARVTRPARSR